MTFVSYAQNFEDVMLWRALSDISNGFYIDIGAWSADIDSVTRAFYERGWTGINIEPNPEFNSQLEDRRPKDINLCLAMGDKEEVVEMNFLGNPGLSTLDDHIAKQHHQDGWNLSRKKVQVITLSTLWDEHVPQGQDVHFLKVDVEGLEAAVLRGNDWKKNRPWIVIVEATLPMSQAESHEEWEPILLESDYLFAYADGLNRFYVTKEHEALLRAFKYPPNVFDDFVLSGQLGAEAKAAQAEAKAAQAEAKAAQAEAKAAQAEAKAAQAAAQLQALHSSRSWRITAPLRQTAHQMRLLHEHGPRSRIKAAANKCLRHTVAFVRNKPRLNNAARICAQRLGLTERLRRIYRNSQFYPGQSSERQDVPKELANLTPRARQIYQQLKTSIGEKKGRN